MQCEVAILLKGQADYISAKQSYSTCDSLNNEWVHVCECYFVIQHWQSYLSHVNNNESGADPVHALLV